jgi:hypothetical protein
MLLDFLDILIEYDNFFATINYLNNLSIENHFLLRIKNLPGFSASFEKLRI